MSLISQGISTQAGLSIPSLFPGRAQALLRDGGMGTLLSRLADLMLQIMRALRLHRPLL